MVAPLGPDRIWDYDERNLLSSDTQPESGVTNYLYWDDGLLKTRTDAAGRETSYIYDGQHRLTQINAPGTVMGELASPLHNAQPGTPFAGFCISPAEGWRIPLLGTAWRPERSGTDAHERQR